MRFGYAILVDGKPKGIIGMPFSYAQTSKRRYEAAHPLSKIDIVPVQLGSSVVEQSTEGKSA